MPLFSMDDCEVADFQRNDRSPRSESSAIELALVGGSFAKGLNPGKSG